ncbi:MAG: sterol desaturase family protein [Pseudomonadota bacterium]
MQTLAIVFASFVPMFILERLYPGRKWPVRRLWIVRAVLFNAMQVVAVVLAMMTWDRFLPGLAFWSVEDLGLWGGAAIGYLAITFVYYWWHRARHESSLLWRLLHQLHHSPQRLELITSFYKHPLEIVLNGILSSTILYVLVGANAAQAGLAVLLTGVAELFYHWNVRTPHWIGFFVQRPESHCVHHARAAHTMNYSDLPLWDMLFGTFHNPRETSFDCGFAGDGELQIGRMLLACEPDVEECDDASHD